MGKVRELLIKVSLDNLIYKRAAEKNSQKFENYT